MSTSFGAQREAVCIWKDGCSHCRKRVALLVSEETCPETFHCPQSKSRWTFGGRVTIFASELDAMSEAEFNELVGQDGLQTLQILFD